MDAGLAPISTPMVAAPIRHGPGTAPDRHGLFTAIGVSLGLVHDVHQAADAGAEADSEAVARHGRTVQSRVSHGLARGDHREGLDPAQTAGVGPAKVRGQVYVGLAGDTRGEPAAQG